MSDLLKNISSEIMDICSKEKLCDWDHVVRVARMAIKIGQQEKNVNMEIIQLASLLHVLSNPLYNQKEKGLKQIVALLKVNKVSHDTISNILDICENVHFQGSAVKTEMKTIEGKIVQDAHRLETIGAVGLVDLFQKGVIQNKDVYSENEKIKKHITLEAYLNSKTSSIGMMHEELYLIKDQMNTLAGKRIAAKRHNFMKKFESQYKSEWLGQDADPIIAKIQANSPWQDPYFQHFMALMQNALKQPIKFEKMGFMAIPLLGNKKKSTKKDKEKEKDK